MQIFIKCMNDQPYSPPYVCYSQSRTENLYKKHAGTSRAHASRTSWMPSPRGALLLCNSCAHSLTRSRPTAVSSTRASFTAAPTAGALIAPQKQNLKPAHKSKPAPQHRRQHQLPSVRDMACRRPQVVADDVRRQQRRWTLRRLRHMRALPVGHLWKVLKE